MKTRTKAALTVLCALLLVVATFLGTLAYMTSKATVTNTFTVGNVTITMDEAKTDLYGVKLNTEGNVFEDNGDTIADRVMANDLKLIPGHTYTKDPTVHVTADSEPCWVFVEVSDDIKALQAETTVANQITAKGWTQLVVDEVPVEGVYYIDHATMGVADYDVFETLTIKTDVDLNAFMAGYDNVNKPTLSLTAYAIQKDGLATVAAAWTAVNAAQN